MSSILRIMGSMINVIEHAAEGYREELKRERNEELARWVAESHSREESLALLIAVGMRHAHGVQECAAV